MKEITLSEREMACLMALNEILDDSGEGQCTYFRFIAKHSKLTEAQTRKSVRALARKGLAEYHRGLFDEDGIVAGSGYCLSIAGKKMADREIEKKEIAQSQQVIPSLSNTQKKDTGV